MIFKYYFPPPARLIRSCVGMGVNECLYESITGSGPSTSSVGVTRQGEKGLAGDVVSVGDWITAKVLDIDRLSKLQPQLRWMGDLESERVGN